MLEPEPFTGPTHPGLDLVDYHARPASLHMSRAVVMNSASGGYHPSLSLNRLPQHDSGRVPVDRRFQRLRVVERDEGERLGKQWLETGLVFYLAGRGSAPAVRPWNEFRRPRSCARRALKANLSAASLASAPLFTNRKRPSGPGTIDAPASPKIRLLLHVVQVADAHSSSGPVPYRLHQGWMIMPQRVDRDARPHSLCNGFPAGRTGIPFPRWEADILAAIVLKQIC